jgi:hypothetical protein
MATGRGTAPRLLPFHSFPQKSGSGYCRQGVVNMADLVLRYEPNGTLHAPRREAEAALPGRRSDAGMLGYGLRCAVSFILACARKGT